MSTIVIATDGSDAAWKAAEKGLEIARAAGDDVVFVGVWDMIRGGFGEPLAYLDPTPYVEADKKKANLALEEAKTRAVELGVHAEIDLREGDPTVEICRAADEQNARLIVMGSHGWGGMRSFIHGSVLSGVRTYSPCPVLTGTPGTREPVEQAQTTVGAKP